MDQRIGFRSPASTNPATSQRWIESVQAHLGSRGKDGGIQKLIIDPLADFEIMAVLTVKFLEKIADHWPTGEPLDKARKRELYDAASLVNVLLLELRRSRTSDESGSDQDSGA